jgi:hypothetical protein
MMKSKILITVITSTVLGIFIAAVYQRLGDLFFYSVFIGSFAAGFVCYLFIRIIWRKQKSNLIDAIYPVTISSLLTFSFLSTIPLTVDRSFSVWMLRTVAAQELSDNDVSQQVLETKSLQFFSVENGQLQRRIDEQLRIGNLEFTNEYRLTWKGWLVVRFNQLIGVVFNLEPEYSKISKR